MFDIKVVIPTYNELFLEDTLLSLKNCKIPSSKVELIIAINHTIDTSNEIINQNYKTLEMVDSFKSDNFEIYAEIFVLPKQSVGHARKMGMDLAYKKLETSNTIKNGIIVNLDADCTVSENYFVAIENHFNKFHKTPSASIYFEHITTDNQYIINYELHLRFMINSLRWAGHPYAFHTVGSSMATRAEAYKKQGGMNTRQAGEDFYFLQKMMDLGGFTDILDTTVFPSSRISDRVPFGTGRAMGDMVKENMWYSYDFQTYRDIKNLIFQIEILYSNIQNLNLSEPMLKYLESVDYMSKIAEIKLNTSNYQAFRKRFFNWFNGFMVIKYLNFCRENYYNKIEVKDAIKPLFEILFPEKIFLNSSEMLMCIRSFDKNRGQYVSL